MTQNNLQLHLSWLSKTNLVPPVGASTPALTPAGDSTTSSFGPPPRSFHSQREAVAEREDRPSQSQPAPPTNPFSDFARPERRPTAVSKSQTSRLTRSNSEESMARLVSAPSTSKSKLASQVPKNQQLATPASTTNSLLGAYNASFKPNGLSIKILLDLKIFTKLFRTIIKKY